jgi:RimJ/RimL family protein N-acetyltransferase
VERGCGRLEWSVLDWNEPSIRFYRSLGAVPMDEWTVQRVSGDALARLAADAPVAAR